MPALNFPTSPVDGQTYDNWVFSSAKGAWLSKLVDSAVVYTGDVAPATPAENDMWYNTLNGTLYIYYVDVDSSQWVQVRANSALEQSILARIENLETQVGQVSPNYVINGGFDIWQRGTSFTNIANTYCVDRWVGLRGAFDSGMNVSQILTSGLAGTRYGARIQRASGNTSVNNLRFGTTFETANSIPLAGKTVTLSFYARAGANFSAAGSTLSFFLRSGTGIDETQIAASDNFINGSSTVFSSTVTLTTSWQRFTFTGLVPSNSSQLGMRFDYTPAGTAGAADFFEITGVQLEAGAIATPFRRSGNTIQEELANCQRYFWRNNPSALGNGLHGTKTSGTQAEAKVFHPVVMRAAPSSITIYATGTVYSYNANSSVTPTGYTLAVSSADHATISTTGVTVTGTAGTNVAIDNMSMGFNAEL